jgi:hypothetical protein
MHVDIPRQLCHILIPSFGNTVNLGGGVQPFTQQ